MPKAVVLVSSDTSYLERKLSILNYQTYPIDEFNHKNIHMLRDLDFTNNFINFFHSFDWFFFYNRCYKFTNKFTTSKTMVVLSTHP